MHGTDAGTTDEERAGGRDVAARPVHDDASTTEDRHRAVIGGASEEQAMRRDDDAQRAEDTRVANALREQVAKSVLDVLGRYQQIAGDHGPVFLRYVTLAALVEVLGTLLEDAIEADAERARPWARETLARLDAFVGQRPQRLH
jgi:hypothetical protein